MITAQLSLTALPGIPAIRPGDDLPELIATSLADANLTPLTGDIVVLAQKIVSKAERRQLALSEVAPSVRAYELAKKVGKDARMVELILSEAREVLRVRPGLIVVEHRLGFVMANAGIDQSNIYHGNSESALLLPLNPDVSADAIRRTVNDRFDVDVAVLIIDSIGRAWRSGTVGQAIGVAGMAALLDLRGRTDLHGRTLRTSELGLADEVASAASLLMGQGDEGRPVVLVRGVTYPRQEGRAGDLVRPRQMDLFR